MSSVGHWVKQLGCDWLSHRSYTS